MKQTLSKLLVSFFFLPGLASAHSNIEQATGLMHGFAHPIAGADHVLAMVAVGIWAAHTGRRALWVFPCAFVGIMVLGGILGFSGAPVPFVEEGILISILVFGVLIAGTFRLPLIYGSAVVGIFAIFHGHAHGSEMHPSASAVPYAIGFALATAMLHACGIGLGMLMQKTNLRAVSRITGGAIALSGLYLCFGL